MAAAEGARLRRAAAAVMRDFAGTIVEGAMGKLPGALTAPGGALHPEPRARALAEELRELLREVPPPPLPPVLTGQVSSLHPY